METGDPRWVTKVHPATRELATDDPLELMAEPVSGDPEVMLECMLQEFLWLGWDVPELLGLFRSPAYPLLWSMREHFGEEAVRQRVTDLVERWGVLQFRATVVEPDDEEETHDLVPLSLPRQAPAGPGGVPLGLCTDASESRSPTDDPAPQPLAPWEEKRGARWPAGVDGPDGSRNEHFRNSATADHRP